MSTHNLCFLVEIRKILFGYPLFFLFFFAVLDCTLLVFFGIICHGDSSEFQHFGVKVMRKVENYCSIYLLSRTLGIHGQ